MIDPVLSTNLASLTCEESKVLLSINTSIDIKQAVLGGDHSA